MEHVITKHVLTIWKATVYYMIFNMASDILDPTSTKLSNPKKIVIVSKKTLMLPQDGKVTG
jgi:hypothetical protein